MEHTMKKGETTSTTEKEKLRRICKAFPLLSEDKQDYVLGIMQALVFAGSAAKKKRTKSP